MTAEVAFVPTYFSIFLEAGLLPRKATMQSAIDSRSFVFQLPDEKSTTPTMAATQLAMEGAHGSNSGSKAVTAAATATFTTQVTAPFAVFFTQLGIIPEKSLQTVELALQ